MNIKIQENKKLDIICVGAVGIDTNVYLYTDEINFDVEMNFSENIDSVGQAGGYSAKIMNFLGFKTGFIGYIGDDYHGRYIKNEFLNENIEALWFSDLKGTKRSINIMNKFGERKNFYDGKGSMLVQPNLEICKEFLKKTKLVHINIVNWSRFLLPLAKELGNTISCDLQDIYDPHDEYRKDFIIASDILFMSAVNIPNIQLFLDEIRKLNSEAIIIIGMGKKGAGLSIKGSKFMIFPCPQLNLSIVDTNGAGDSLAMGFISSFIFWKKNIYNSVLLGQILAQNTCSMKAPKNNFVSKEKLISSFERINKEYFLKYNQY